MYTPERSLSLSALIVTFRSHSGQVALEDAPLLFPKYTASQTSTCWSSTRVTMLARRSTHHIGQIIPDEGEDRGVPVV